MNKLRLENGRETRLSRVGQVHDRVDGAAMIVIGIGIFVLDCLSPADAAANMAPGEESFDKHVR
jgi:hypothetical protein